eukprot:TRINITY_DN1890_c0_g1_i7.p1 TRINITY_DN1890_c0_g1~~TRINITY_DN1890_c0_g1_i7.p1  ORF type:complete len:1255 (+),score=381.73 TRINITY_DN1890_c0_g1_i7:97-3861(+)
MSRSILDSLVSRYKPSPGSASPKAESATPTPTSPIASPISLRVNDSLPPPTTILSSPTTPELARLHTTPPSEDTELSILRSRVKMLEDERTELMEKVADAEESKARALELENALFTMKGPSDDHDKHKTRIAELEASLAAAALSTQQLQERHDADDKARTLELEEIRSQLHQSHQHGDAAAKELAEAKASGDTVAKERDDAVQRLDAVNKDLETTQQRIAASTSQLDLLQGQLEEARKEAEGARNEAARLAQELEAARTRDDHDGGAGTTSQETTTSEDKDKDNDEDTIPARLEEARLEWDKERDALNAIIQTYKQQQTQPQRTTEDATTSTTPSDEPQQEPPAPTTDEAPDKEDSSSPPSDAPDPSPTPSTSNVSDSPASEPSSDTDGASSIPSSDPSVAEASNTVTTVPPTHPQHSDEDGCRAEKERLEERLKQLEDTLAHTKQEWQEERQQFAERHKQWIKERAQFISQAGDNQSKGTPDHIDSVEPDKTEPSGSAEDDASASPSHATVGEVSTPTAEDDDNGASPESSLAPSEAPPTSSPPTTLPLGDGDTTQVAPAPDKSDVIAPVSSSTATSAPSSPSKSDTDPSIPDGVLSPSPPRSSNDETTSEAPPSSTHTIQPPTGDTDPASVDPNVPVSAPISSSESPRPAEVKQSDVVQATPDTNRDKPSVDVVLLEAQLTDLKGAVLALKEELAAKTRLLAERDAEIASLNASSPSLSQQGKDGSPNIETNSKMFRILTKNSSFKKPKKGAQAKENADSASSSPASSSPVPPHHGEAASRPTLGGSDSPAMVASSSSNSFVLDSSSSPAMESHLSTKPRSSSDSGVSPQQARWAASNAAPAPKPRPPNAISVAGGRPSLERYTADPVIIRSIVRVQSVVRGKMQRENYKMLKKRRTAAQELMTTETSYVNDLDRLIKHYLKPLRLNSHSPDSWVMPSYVDQIFSTIEDIRVNNQQLLFAIAETMSQWNSATCLGNMFQTSFMYLEPHFDYIVNYNQSQQALRTCMKIPQFASFIKVCMDKPELDYKDLNDFLIMPVQRVPRYIMLLSAVLKYTPADHPDFLGLNKAVGMLKVFAEEINHRKASLEKLAELVPKLTGYPPSIVSQHGPLWTPTRYLVREGWLTDDKKKKWYCFLLNDQFIATNPRKRSSAPSYSSSSSSSSSSSPAGSPGPGDEYKVMTVVVITAATTLTAGMAESGNKKAIIDPRTVAITLTLQEKPGGPKYTYTAATHDEVKSWVKDIQAIILKAKNGSK